MVVRCKPNHFLVTGETVFELSESVGVLDTDTYAVAREKLTAYFSPRRNTEYEIFVFRCRDKFLPAVKFFPPPVTLPSVLSAVCIAQN